MEERVSGFRIVGDWGEVVEHGERISEALREADVDGEAFEQWEDWRPKSHELLGKEIREKTARQASVAEGVGEQEGETPNQDLQTAGEKLSESYRKLDENEPEEAVEKWQDSINYVARAADSAGRKALRSVEGAVYRNVMTQVAPYYFDNELISANLGRTGNSSDPFAFEVNVNDDALKEEVADGLAELESAVDRWHGETAKETETAEAAEGVEVTEAERAPSVEDT